MATQQTVSLTQTLSAPAAAVWDVVRAGGDVHRMMPGVIHSCRLEGEGEGARRFCGSDAGELAETLLVVDDDARVFRYRIDEQQMMPVDRYEGTIHVVDVGEGRTQVLWTATFDLLAPEARDEIATNLKGLFALGIEGMGRMAQAAA